MDKVRQQPWCTVAFWVWLKWPARCWPCWNHADIHSCSQEASLKAFRVFSATTWARQRLWLLICPQRLPSVLCPSHHCKISETALAVGTARSIPYSVTVLNLLSWLLWGTDWHVPHSSTKPQRNPHPGQSNPGFVILPFSITFWRLSFSTEQEHCFAGVFL